MQGKRLIDIYLEDDVQRELAITAIALTHDREMQAEDLLQDLAYILLINEDTLKDIKVPIAFFKTCLRNIAINAMKRESRNVPMSPEEVVRIMDASINIENDAQANMEYIEVMNWLQQALSSYPSDKRSAFIRYYIDGHPFEDLAAQLGMSRNALAQQFKRMRTKLEKQVPYLAVIMNILWRGML